MVLSACGMEPAAVTTSSNHPAPNTNGAGASIAVAATSADGVVAVGGSTNSGSHKVSRFTYHPSAAGIFTFCLEGSGAGSMNVSSAAAELFDLDGSGCASTFLEQGDYFFDVAGPSDSAVSVVSTAPADEGQRPATVFVVE